MTGKLKYTVSGGKIVAVNIDAAVILEKNQRSVPREQNSISLHEDEDCAFGSLSMFLNDSPNVRRRIRDFNK